MTLSLAREAHTGFLTESCHQWAQEDCRYLQSMFTDILYQRVSGEHLHTMRISRPLLAAIQSAT